VALGQTFGSIGASPLRGGSDGFVSLLDANGQLLNSVQFGSDASDLPLRAAFDACGDVIVAGLTWGAISSGVQHLGDADAFVMSVPIDH